MEPWSLFPQGNWKAESIPTGLPIVIIGVRGEEMLCCDSEGALVVLKFSEIRLPWRFDHARDDWYELSGEVE